MQASGGRWRALGSTQRWGGGAAAAAALFLSASFWTRVILAFLALVGWCRCTVSKPVLKAPVLSALET